MISPRENNKRTEKEGIIPEVIYIMGTARSGTTILEVLLKSNQDVFGVGEATYIFKDCFRDNVVCGCKKYSLKCSFWGKVQQNFDWKQYKLSEIIDLFRNIEWHHNFFLLFLNLVPKRKMRLYKEFNLRLFNAIQATSGKKIIIDSSKYAGRALALSNIFPGKIKVLCMTRSPRGLLKAFQNKDTREQEPKSLLGTLLYYFYVLLSCRLVSLRTGGGLFQIKYDDLASRPAATLKAIENWSGLDLSQAKAMIDQDEFFEIGHIVTGNRLRLKGKIRFQPSLRIQSASGYSEKATLWIMNLVRLILRF
jgi:hypothetical protein